MFQSVDLFILNGKRWNLMDANLSNINFRYLKCRTDYFSDLSSNLFSPVLFGKLGRSDGINAVKQTVEEICLQFQQVIFFYYLMIKLKSAY